MNKKNLELIEPYDDDPKEEDTEPNDSPHGLPKRKLKIKPRKVKD